MGHISLIKLLCAIATFHILCAYAVENSAYACTQNSQGICAGQGYNQACNATVLCDTAAFLTCDSASGKCGCQNPLNSTYDAKDGKCKLKLEETCSPNANSMPCQEFAFCSGFSGKSKCECNYNYIESDGKCFLPGGEICDITKKNTSIPTCNANSHVECMPFDDLDVGWCFCTNQTNIWFEEETDSCVLLEGSPCTVGDAAQSCAEKAECKEKTAGTNDFQCTCASGADKTSGLCVAYHGERCGSPDNATCKTEAFLTCEADGTDGVHRCTCPKTANLTYDSVTRTCAISPGAKCSAADPYNCASYSECSATGICECVGPLKPGKDGRCKLPYGQSCNFTPSDRWTCDRSSFHSCVGTLKLCSCAGDQLYEDGICKTLAGETCLANRPNLYECVKNSACNATTNRCTCNGPDYSANKAGLCVRGFNATCSATPQDTCNVDGAQKCTNGRCACADPTNMIYNEKDAQCYLTSGSTCIADGVPCNSPLTCRNAVNGKRTCGCDNLSGYFPDDKGSCVKSFNVKCGPYYPLPDVPCDARENLVCDDTYKCACDSRNSTQYGIGFDAMCLKHMDVACNATEDYFGKCDFTNFLDCKGGVCACDSEHETLFSPNVCSGKGGAACKSNENCQSFDCNMTTKKCNGAGRLFLNFGIALLTITLWGFKAY